MNELKTKKCPMIAAALFAGMVLSGNAIWAEEASVSSGKTAATVNEADHSAAKGIAVAAAVPAPVDMHKRAEELQSLKWGMFICWSFSTFSGKEWTSGVKDVSFFKAASVDTDQWVRTAKEAGMGYILFLTKHHDGFCLWDTKTTDRKVTKAPLGRDVLAELKKSCDKYGIKLALYFSEGEWVWPGGIEGKSYKESHGRNPEMKKAQLRELLTQYGPIEYLWLDYAADDGGLSHAETVQWCKQFQPDCFVGFNAGPPAGDIRLGEMGRPTPLVKGKSSSYLLAEFTYPILPGHAGGAQWFYSLPKHDMLCREAEHIYWDYQRGLECKNIFSLCVCPNYEGRLREVDIQTLRRVGEWIRNPSKAPVEEPSLAAGKPFKASEGWGFARMFNNDYYDGYFPAYFKGTSGWIEVDLGKEESVGRVEIFESFHGRIEAFSVEYRQGDGDAWKELARGEKVGRCKALSFPPVQARYIRLNITKAQEKPCVHEFRVLPPAK